MIRFLKVIGMSVTGALLILGVLALVTAPRVVHIGDGYSLIQFLNSRGHSYLVDHGAGDAGEPTVTELPGGETSVVEVRSPDGEKSAVAYATPKTLPGDPFPATRSEMDRAGVLVWRFRIPSDLEEGEYAATEWLIGGEVYESGLSFADVPPGQTATVVLWTGEFTKYYANGFEGSPPPGMPFSLSFPRSGEGSTSRRGMLRVPEGWEEPYGRLASGDYADSGWLMLRCNRSEKDTGRYFANLEFVYKSRSDPNRP